MDLVMGVMGDVALKLFELLKGEYELQKGVRKKLDFLRLELESIEPALHKVAAVPWDQLDEQVKVWARQVKEASYDMEDILDTFLVRVKGCEPVDQSRLKRALKKMGGLFGKAKARHEIDGAIEDIKKQLQEVAERRARYRVDEIVVGTASTSTIDPRLVAMYNEVTKLIGIDKSRDELMSKLLSHDGNDSNGKTKIVSVLGVGGLGKTTLAKAVYDKLKPDFDCGAFVPVGRNPDLKKVLRDILIDLDKEIYMNVRYNILDVRQLINELRDFLGSKRYFIVIDDVWDIKTWETIKSALDQKNGGSRVITTTRNREVASSEEVFDLAPLSCDNSKKLFYTRLFGGEGKCPDNHPVEASDKILRKCGGVPLAIITMASLLVGKSEQDWLDLCNSPGFYRGKDSKQVDDTVWILSLSYYDMPSDLRTCLLYLSVYPEDCEIQKDCLIWKWIAEGFVQRKTGSSSLFQRGEEYFNQLINRSMIQPVEDMGIIYGCRVHDMVLDLIRGFSDEENFVTIVSNNDDDQGTPRNKVRRLARHNRKVMQTQEDNHMGVAQVRSLVAYSCDVGSLVLHPSFELLRVLALEKCDTQKAGWQGLKHLGNLLHLRYLGLRHTYGDYDLPEEIGRLKFLQTLDLEGSYIGLLPLGVCQLTQLLCLCGDNQTSVPDGFLTKVTSLEELSICIHNLIDLSSRQKFMKALGNLRELRVLKIRGNFEETQPDLVQSLGKLHKLQHLELMGYKRQKDLDEWDRVVLPRHLRSLNLDAIPFCRLPSCIGLQHLCSLYYLRLCVDDVDEAGLRALGRLPELGSLELMSSMSLAPTMASRATVIIAGDAFFQKLRYCFLYDWMVQMVVNQDSTSVSFSIWKGDQQGAMAFGSKTKDEHSRAAIAAAPPVMVMPNLEELWFDVPLKAWCKDGNGSSCECDDLGLQLQCLPSLRIVEVSVNCEGVFADDVEKAKAALRHAAELNPNRPILEIKLRNEVQMMGQSTDEDGEESHDGHDLSVEGYKGEVSLAGNE